MLAAPNAVLSGIFFDPSSTTGAAIPDHLSDSSSSSTDNAGLMNRVAVAANDQFGDIAPDDTGTVHFTSSDPQVLSPGNDIFTDESLMPITQDIKQKDRPIWA
jgi:hypothetical protein